MSIWNKILVGFIFIASVAFFYLAMRTLKTHKEWRELAQKHERGISKLEKENYVLEFGDLAEGEKGIVQLRQELKLLADRGRVWYNCSPDPVKIDNPDDPDKRKVRVAVKTDLPGEHMIAKSAILYVFEEDAVASGGRYLGEFMVTAVDKRMVQIEPAMKLSDGELQQLAASRGPWTLYEVMPVDTRSIFANLDEDRKRTLLPESTVTEYLKDGKAAEPNDPEDRVAGGKYVRWLRDYGALFKWFHLQRNSLTDLFEAARSDKGFAKGAHEEALKHEQSLEDEKAKLSAELVKYQTQHKAVVALRQLLQSRVDNIRVAVNRLVAQNLAAAAQIAKIQFEAARRIDARTRTMAQAEAD